MGPLAVVLGYSLAHLGETLGVRHRYYDRRI